MAKPSLEPSTISHGPRAQPATLAGYYAKGLRAKLGNLRASHLAYTFIAHVTQSARIMIIA